MGGLSAPIDVDDRDPTGVEDSELRRASAGACRSTHRITPKSCEQTLEEAWSGLAANQCCAQVDAALNDPSCVAGLAVGLFSAGSEVGGCAVCPGGGAAYAGLADAGGAGLVSLVVAHAGSQLADQVWHLHTWIAVGSQYPKLATSDFHFEEGEVKRGEMRWSVESRVAWVAQSGGG